MYFEDGENKYKAPKPGCGKCLKSRATGGCSKHTNVWSEMPWYRKYSDEIAWFVMIIIIGYSAMFISSNIVYMREVADMVIAK